MFEPSLVVELLPLLFFFVTCAMLMLGYPVAFTLAGSALIFAGIGIALGIFDPNLLLAYPSRVFGTMTNGTLVAVPLFVFMGVMLEKSRIAEVLLADLSRLLGRLPGGLAVAVLIVGMLMAASTGIVGATVVTMGLMSLPTMLNNRYDPQLATGIICATGTLGQIIPPSIALVLLGDVLSTAYQQAQNAQGIVSPDTVSVGDLFIGALIPGVLLVVCYGIYVVTRVALQPSLAPSISADSRADGEENTVSLHHTLRSLLPPIALMVCVLGSILMGIATPTEAAGVGAMGAMLLAFINKQLDINTLRSVVRSTTETTAMVFMILLGASLFSLVFRGFGGDALIEAFFADLPGGKWTALLLVMLVVFLLGFILDFIEITFVVVPIVGPILLAMDIDPVWLGIMLAVNLQTSFLTPPFGFALFYLRGVSPESVTTGTIYRGVVPFIVIQLLLLVLLAAYPSLATWLPITLG
ncbi:TRAP transporter large permease subunit [Aurantivibrio plasticivorans]